MSINDIYKTDSKRLAKLMELDERTKDPALPAELATIWRHQLDAPLELDLTTEIRKTSTNYETAILATRTPPKTFRELFIHLQPPIELLKLAKDFAKSHAHGTGSPLPQEIALALYYTSIVAALTRCRQRITSLDDARLRSGFEWGMAQTWVDESTRSLFQEGLKQLRTLQ